MNKETLCIFQRVIHCGVNTAVQPTVDYQFAWPYQLCRAAFGSISSACVYRQSVSSNECLSMSRNGKYQGRETFLIY